MSDLPECIVCGDETRHRGGGRPNPEGDRPLCRSCCPDCINDPVDKADAIFNLAAVSAAIYLKELRVYEREMAQVEVQALLNEPNQTGRRTEP